MLRAALFALVGIAVVARSGAAQVFDVKSARPVRIWTSLSVGHLRQGWVYDGSTGTLWAFGDGLTYRGSIEIPLRNEAAVGVSGGWARMPLRYRSLTIPGSQVDADADVWSALAMFRMGGGQGFHQVIELSAGVVGFENFRADDGTRLQPKGGDRDFAFTLGYGFGYTLRSSAQIVLVMDRSFVLHQREGLSGDQGSRTDQSIIRAGLRFGFRGK